jgi:hypothetical protein
VLLTRKKLSALPGEMEAITLAAGLLDGVEGDLTVTAEVKE